jgi:predicted nuclease of predicted toxin-antitoxin system
LLFDENLSPKLPRLLATLFPDSAHVRDCGLLGLPDEDVWEFARVHGFIIISKDCVLISCSLSAIPSESSASPIRKKIP